jgi:hypothetical protein
MDFAELDAFDARLGALRRGMVVVSLFVLLALLLSPRLPCEPPTGDATAPPETEAAPAGGP